MSIETFFNTLKKIGLGGLTTIIIAFIAFNSFYTVGGTEVAIERTPSGEMQGIVDPGVHFKVPFLSTVHYYDMYQTVAYVDTDTGEGVGTMKLITFADTYMGYVGGTFRFKLPSDPTMLVAMHKAFLNEQNLLSAGLRPIAKQLLTYTANQITGEDFMQGGTNTYQARVEDQGNNGLYVTKREKLLVKKVASDVGIDNQNPTERTQRDSYVHLNVRQKDDKGNFLRQELPTTRYGIQVVQVTIDDFRPEPKLMDFINRKKAQIAKRQGLIEDQENERQSAITAELKGTRERVEARQQMLKEKDAAGINAQKKVELEQKEADLQVVRKNKELEIAQANLNIQKANALAAVEQAKAIEAKGLAEARVKSAMYKAVRQSVLQLEVEKVTQLAKYKALGTANITLPSTVVMGGSGEGSQDGLQSLTNLHIMEKLK